MNEVGFSGGFREKWRRSSQGLLVLSVLYFLGFGSV